MLKKLTTHKKHLDSTHEPQQPKNDSKNPTAPMPKKRVSAVKVMFSGSKEEYPWKVIRNHRPAPRKPHEHICGWEISHKYLLKS